MHVFWLVFVLIRFPEGIANFVSLSSQDFHLRLFVFFPLDMHAKNFVLQQIREK